MHRKLALLLTIFALATSACSHRRAWGERSESLETADRDGDGQVSRAEFLEARHARFLQLDRNSDGFIAADDFGRRLKRNADRQGRLETAIREMDANGDGRVSRAEFDSQSQKNFQRLDGDGNGLLTSPEIAAGAQALRAETR
jgi:Ca2+-binding EF-hand superfamily protein